MPTKTAQRRRWPKWTLFLAFWTLVGLSFASQFYLANSKAGSPVPWTQAVSIYLGDWYVFALLSIPAVKLGQRFEFEKNRRTVFWVAVLHLVASFLFSCTYILLRAWVGQIQSAWNGTPITFGQATNFLGKTFLYNVWVYWVILAVVNAFQFYTKFHDRELRTSELETRLAQARLQALQSQLNPHFLFNTLHTISALMHKDVDAADRMIMKLSELLRLALDNTEVHEVLLSQELDFLKRYLEIEQTRFRERLTVEMDIEPETLRAKVPNLVLQPLVENAIRHGIERHARRGKIVLRARQDVGRLQLEVEDNGNGIANLSGTREGIGLSNTRNRLTHLYGSEQSFELQNVVGGGLLARVVIPWNVEHRSMNAETKT
jgi:two-component system LytT family sensor kinase